MTYAVPKTQKLKAPILQGLTTVSSTQYHDLGLAIAATTGEEFRYVQASTTLTAAPCAAYPAYFVGSTAKWCVTTTAGGTRGDNFAGMLCAAINNTAPGTNYVWIQTKGYVPSGCVSAAAGNSIMAGTTGRLAVVQTAASCTAYTACGVCLQDSSGDKADLILSDQ